MSEEGKSAQDSSMAMKPSSSLSKIFKSVKPHSSNLIPPSKPTSPKFSQIPSNLSPQISSSSSSSSKSKSGWHVYLILSTNPPFKTYVGVTNNFSRRLKQHNGELKGGAKATHVGRPWICACLIQGFLDKSKACEFESRWKIISRKSPRKRSRSKDEDQSDNPQLLLLRHRYAALNKVKDLIDCSHLEIDWQQDPI